MLWMSVNAKTREKIIIFGVQRQVQERGAMSIHACSYIHDPHMRLVQVPTIHQTIYNIEWQHKHRSIVKKHN